MRFTSGYPRAYGLHCPFRAQGSSSLDSFLQFTLFLQYQTYHFVHRVTSTRQSFNTLEKRNGVGDLPRKRRKYQGYTIDTTFHRPADCIRD